MSYQKEITVINQSIKQYDDSTFKTERIICLQVLNAQTSNSDCLNRMKNKN